MKKRLHKKLSRRPWPRFWNERRWRAFEAAADRSHRPVRRRMLALESAGPHAIWFSVPILPFCTCAEPVVSMTSYKCHACGRNRQPPRYLEGPQGPVLKSFLTQKGTR